MYANALKTITIPSSSNQGLNISENSFSNCTSLQSVTLLSGVLVIGGNSFYESKNLSIIKIPNSVQTIGIIIIIIIIIISIK